MFAEFIRKTQRWEQQLLAIPNLLDLKKARFSYQITESARSLHIIGRRLIYQTNFLKVKEYKYILYNNNNYNKYLILINKN